MLYLFRRRVLGRQQYGFPQQIQGGFILGEETEVLTYQCSKRNLWLGLGYWNAMMGYDQSLAYSTALHLPFTVPCTVTVPLYVPVSVTQKHEKEWQQQTYF